MHAGVLEERYQVRQPGRLLQGDWLGLERKHLFPLCQPYAPALDGVLSFAQALVQTSFPLVLKADEQVTFVHVTDQSGSERALGPSQFSYDRTARTLNVQPASLNATDRTLRVEITSDCRPIVK